MTYPDHILSPLYREDSIMALITKEMYLRHIYIKSNMAANIQEVKDYFSPLQKPIVEKVIKVRHKKGQATLSRSMHDQLLSCLQDAIQNFPQENDSDWRRVKIWTENIAEAAQASRIAKLEADRINQTHSEGNIKYVDRFSVV